MPVCLPDQSNRPDKSRVNYGTPGDYNASGTVEQADLVLLHWGGARCGSSRTFRDLISPGPMIGLTSGTTSGAKTFGELE